MGKNKISSRYQNSAKVYYEGKIGFDDVPDIGENYNAAIYVYDNCQLIT